MINEYTAVIKRKVNGGLAGSRRCLALIVRSALGTSCSIVSELR